MINYKKRFLTLSKENQESIREAHSVARDIVAAIDILAKKKVAYKTLTGIIGINEAINACNIALENLEYNMQLLWGFKEDSNYHTWWLEPEQCTCPALDNKDPMFYGAGKIINGACPVHGKHILEYHRAMIRGFLEQLDPVNICVHRGDDTYNYRGFKSQDASLERVPDELFLYYVSKDDNGETILRGTRNDTTIYSVFSFVALPEGMCEILDV